MCSPRLSPPSCPHSPPPPPPPAAHTQTPPLLHTQTDAHLAGACARGACRASRGRRGSRPRCLGRAEARRAARTGTRLQEGSQSLRHSQPRRPTKSARQTGRGCAEGPGFRGTVAASGEGNCHFRPPPPPTHTHIHTNTHHDHAVVLANGVAVGTASGRRSSAVRNRRRTIGRKRPVVKRALSSKE
jgi:hypothetical protein